MAVFRIEKNKNYTAFEENRMSLSRFVETNQNKPNFVSVSGIAMQ